MPRLTPPTGGVGEALERVLGSDTFARSGRARDLLRYLVAREQAGGADTLKGYAIALDVFGRDDEFDPSTDAVVRVQARRLRDLLAQYYGGEGADDPLRIDIPLGNYVPSYATPGDDGRSDAVGASDHPAAEASDTVTAEQAPAEVAPLAGPRAFRTPFNVQHHLRLIWVAMSAVIVLLGFVAYRVGFPGPDAGVQGPQETAEITSAITRLLPTVHVEAEASDGDVDKVAAVLRGALAGFDTLEYVARSYDSRRAGSEHKTVFLFQISQVPGSPNIRVDLRHAPSARIIVTREIQPEDAADMIADLLTTVAPASGVIYAYIANNGLATPLIDCLLKNDYYYRDPSENHFVQAFDCMKTLEAEGHRSPLIHSELASLELQGMLGGYEAAQEFTRESALEGARRAIQMGPASPYAHRSYGYLLLRLGNDSEGLAWMHKAYDLNPHDLSMAASYAYALVFSGNYADAVPILERAVRASSSHPSWWDYSLFLARFMLGDTEEAANATLALQTTKRAHYLAVRMIVAHQHGDADKVDELRSVIVEEYPLFAADPRAYFVEARYPADLVDRLMEAISAAGLVSAS